ncbi:piggyBac transposable element-derived protein 4 [Trichonephila clavipes]|nr:piggyBac transposable element-derived protein 4 [Trichonephila clavipes]
MILTSRKRHFYLVGQSKHKVGACGVNNQASAVLAGNELPFVAFSLSLPFACRILLRRAVWFTLKMNSDSENECLIEERSSDEEFSSSESESDDDCLDSARDWCQIDVTSPLPSHPKFPFTGNPGIKETNRYAESFFENAELTPGSRALKWKNTNKEEMKRFIALLLLQGVVQKPVEQWFWSKRPILSTPFFGKVMVHKFKSVYVPKPDISVDESLIAYKGRLSWKQYIPQKRARFGIKLFQLCESESGYIWNSLIYTGKGTAFNENYNDYGLSTKSVLTLIHELKVKGYCLSTDNFYTSPELAELLIDSKTVICGTLRPNRKGLPVSFKSSTLKKGEIIAFQKGPPAVLTGEGIKLPCVFEAVREIYRNILANASFEKVDRFRSEIQLAGHPLRGTATAGSDVAQSGRPIFNDFFQHLWPYIGNNTANVVFQMVKRLWLIRIDQ